MRALAQNLQFLRPADPGRAGVPIRWPAVAGLLLVHAVGTALVVRLSLHAFWIVVPCLLILTSVRVRRVHLETLAPLFLVYCLALARVVFALSVGAVGADTSEHVPEPWGTYLDLDVGMAVGGLWAVLVQLRQRFLTAECFGLSVALIALVWAAGTYVGQRTHGVTASDPYAYVQMAVDLADHGSPVDRFAFAQTLEAWGLPTLLAVPVGYNEPDPNTGLSASAWPPGYSGFLAFAYRIAGEPGLYLLTPLFGIATLGATWWLGIELLATSEGTRPRLQAQWLAAGVAVVVLATSYEQVQRVVVPMADIPAQCFSTLAVAAAFRSLRTHTRLFAVVAGVCLGCAFAIRYTQVLLAVALAAVWIAARPRRWDAALACGIAAWLPALPVLIYNATTFGHPVATGSAELALFGASSVLENVRSVGADLVSPGEFLLLVPFLAIGAVWIAREVPRRGLPLLLWVVVIVGFHVPYAGLRLRDLLTIFPALATVSGLGVAAWVGPARTRGWITALLVVVFWVRSVPTLAATAPGARFDAFGYLQPEQRQAFEALHEATPAGAVVASTLNGGPIELYAQRTAVRPSASSEADWLRFLALAVPSRPIYILADGVANESFVRSAATRYRLEEKAQLPLPYFTEDGGSTGRVVRLLQIVPEQSAASEPGLNPA